MNKELLIPPTKRQQSRLNNLYPKLQAGEIIVVPNDVNLIIDDVEINQSQREEISNQLTRKVVFLEAGELTRNLPLSTTTKQVVIFPLNGALQVENRLTLPENTPTTQVKISRRPEDIIYGRKIEKTEQVLDTLNTVKPEEVEVIDDVVVTGSTFRSIRELAEKELNRTFMWALTTWLASYPPKQNRSPSGVYGASKTATSLVYIRESGGTPPLNSLSTWLFDQDKGELVLNLYAQKYASNPNAFISLINQIREAV